MFACLLCRQRSCHSEVATAVVQYPQLWLSFRKSASLEQNSALSQAIMLVCNDSFAGQSPKIFSCTLMIKDMEQMFAVVLSCRDEES